MAQFGVKYTLNSYMLCAFSVYPCAGILRYMKGLNGLTRQVKSKQRVADHGEVYTAEREVKAMCDLVAEECLRIDSRFLEPACGDGNFLHEILTRKLTVVQSRYKKSVSDYERNAILALTSIYGVDILQDNVEECRERLFGLWDKFYRDTCKKEVKEACREAARYILSRNILCGNALSLNCVDESGQDTDDPIIFSEWDFVVGDLIKRRDFRLDVLMNENPDKQHYDMQLSLFAEDVSGSENWMIDPDTGKSIPKPIREYEPIHYRRIQEHE